MTGQQRPVLVIGDAMLDRDITGDITGNVPDTTAPVVTLTRHHERPGGAALAALAVARTGTPVTLAAPLADDPDGNRLQQLLPGVTVLPLATLAGTRTLTRVRSEPEGTLLRYDTPGSHLPATALVRADALAEAVNSAAGVLVSDYGAGTTAHPAVRRAIEVALRLGLPVVWDPHPRGAAPVESVTAATPNRREIDLAITRAGRHHPESLAAASRELLRLWNAHAIVATDGNRGALTVTANRCQVATAPQQVPGDACGAGDHFAAALTSALVGGLLLSVATEQAVDLTATWLQAGGVSAASTLVGPVSSEHTAPSETGVVVATGGCFDVVHPGHIASLQAARRLGDRLVVLLNSDESIRRLKGPDRPYHQVADRRRVLQSLACVDEVIVFDDDTPARALTDLRPAIWAKGADYTDAPMPEADLLQQWGGRVALLPYLDGHSTTRILTGAAR